MKKQVELPEEYKKTLKLFSYYCMSMGGNEVQKWESIEECAISAWNNHWDKGSGQLIEGYKEINSVLEQIYEYIDFQKENVKSIKLLTYHCKLLNL